MFYYKIITTDESLRGDNFKLEDIVKYIPKFNIGWKFEDVRDKDRINTSTFCPFNNKYNVNLSPKWCEKISKEEYDNIEPEKSKIMRKSRFKIGDKVTYRKDLESYYHGGYDSSFNGYVGTVINVEKFISSEKGYKISVTTPTGRYAMAEFEFEEFTGKSTKSIFKKGDYIVVTDGNERSFEVNFCFKQREDMSWIRPELDCRGSNTNGYTSVDISSSHNWRYATDIEKTHYEKVKKPYNVLSLIGISNVDSDDSDFELKNSSFTTGDTVEVFQSYKSDRYCSWANSMNEYIGETGTITSIYNTSVYINFTSCDNHYDDFSFPIKSLRKVSKLDIKPESSDIEKCELLDEMPISKADSNKNYTTPITVEPLVVESY